VKKILLFLVLIAAIFSSCKQDPCRTLVCLNEGICMDGLCNCQVGYFGEECENYDPCYKVDCLNGGACKEGKCECSNGFEGEYCKIDQREQFYGNYFTNVDNTCYPNSSFLLVTVSKNSPGKIWVEIDGVKLYASIYFVQSNKADFFIQSQFKNGYNYYGQGALNITYDFNTNTIYGYSVQYLINKEDNATLSKCYMGGSGYKE
jgi:hypothetical protein